MADGAQFSKSSDRHSDGKRPRVALTGEEFGFGYQAVNQWVRRHADGADRRLLDGGVSAAGKKAGVSIKNSGFDPTRPDRQPLHTKEQSLVAVRNGAADLAIVPFFTPNVGYDTETFATLSSLLTLLAVDHIDATDRLCLAVYEPQMLDLVQSAHPGSGLSTLLRDKRSRWHSNDSSRFADPFESGGEGNQQYAAGLQIDASAQYMLRERIDMVFAGPEAARRCKTKLDGLRGAGLEVRETLNSVEPHREMARLARGTLNNSRQTNTLFDPRDGRTQFVSTMAADNPTAKLYGVIMPFEIAARSSDFVIIDDDVEDSDPSDAASQTQFLVVRNVPDRTIMDDKLNTRSKRLSVWMKRLRAVSEDGKNGGVRVMLRFSRAGEAAATSDVEEVLRHGGVRYSMFKIDEDVGQDSPSPVVLDIEFDDEHLSGNPLAPSMAEKVMSRAFTRWKNRSVLVIAAMPMRGQRLADAKRRRWFAEAVLSYVSDVTNSLWVNYRIWASIAAGAAVYHFFGSSIGAFLRSMFGG